jgi:WD40 repeat protein
LLPANNKERHVCLDPSEFIASPCSIICAGSIDGKIRVWSIAEKQQGVVLATAQLHQDMVTAVGFSLNGGRVLAGTMRGRVRFYELADRKLEYVAQVRGGLRLGLRQFA